MATAAREDLDDHLEQTRVVLANLQCSLPKVVSVASLGVRSKTPYKALCVREALAWRTEELARNAIDALSREEVVTGALLTRSVLEGTALVWRLGEHLSRRAEYGPDVLDEKVMAMLMGHRNVEGMPEAVRITRHLERLDKAMGGEILRVYAHLSEIAHPNWTGVNAVYSRIDFEAFETHFGRNLERRFGLLVGTAIQLRATLGTFEFAYNEITRIYPAYLAELEPF